MKTLCKIVTDDWDLVIRGNKVTDKCDKLESVLAKRNKTLPVASLRFSPMINWHLPNLSSSLQVKIADIPLYRPAFFENTQYAFDFHFKKGIKNPQVKHDLVRINDAFYTDEAENLTLRGQLNFGNELGWFRLPICYEKQGKPVSNAISFEVWPTKMDMDSDLDKIHQTLDAVHPYLKFSFAKSTKQSFQRNKHSHSPFDVLWIAQFQSLMEQLHEGFNQVLKAPHNRLLPKTKSLKAQKLKGKITPKLGQRVIQDIMAGQYDKRYTVQQKHLSVDTPENQFIKHVLNSLVKKTENFSNKAKQADNVKNPNLSEHFYKGLQQLSSPFQKLQTHSLFTEVGNFQGLKKASLVLQQKTGYAAIFKAWQELKSYLDILGQDAHISTKTVAELYELWCFLEIARTLEEDFQFVKINQADVSSKTHKAIEYQARDLHFDFEKTISVDEKIKITLRHEKTFGSDKRLPNKGGIVAWMTQHKPDIFMEIEFTQCKSKFVFLFDAKYRIDLDHDEMDWVPNDALYQMHRYRDALIYQERPDENLDWIRSRPVYGAYALYPGYFDQQAETNPYHQTIDDVDIGAFAFLPGRENHWLKRFLSEILTTTHSNLQEAPDANNGILSPQARVIKQRKSTAIILR